MDLPVIAIVGRPNVGKSALFNRIAGRRISIVHEQAGVTRDRIATPASHAGREFLLIDTGGLGVLPEQTRKTQAFDGLIRDQVQVALAEANCIIWMVDARSGITEMDRVIGEYVRKSAGCPVILTANKTDNQQMEEQALSEFAELGFEEPLPISCMHGLGVWELLDACLPHLPKQAPSDAPPPPEPLKISVIGRPNVGKSSLVNALLDEERVLVSEVAGTTRDAVDIPFDLQTDDGAFPMTLIDTAGLRKRNRLDTVVEYFSVLRTENAIRRSDVVLLLLDAVAPGTAQDRRIAHIVAEQRKPCILVANKADLAREQMSEEQIAEEVVARVSFLSYAPVVVLSALECWNIDDIWEELVAVYETIHRNIPTAVLNQMLRDAVARTPPPVEANRFFKLFYATQTDRVPPEFILFVNDPALCPENYRTFLENRLRQAFFADAAVPLRLRLRARHKDLKNERGRRQSAAGKARQRQTERSDVERRKQRRRGYRG